MSEAELPLGELIPEMVAMSEDEYRDYLRSDELMYINHHDNLRSFISGYPIACTQWQVDFLIEHLKIIRDKVGD
jgi:hypothetical protein